MKKIFYSLFLIGALTCQEIKTNLKTFRTLYRCENEEVICYTFTTAIGYGGAGSMSCKFKELKQDD